MLLPDVLVVGIAVPSYVTVIPEFAAKLLPVTVTDVPVGPLDGFSVTDAAGGRAVTVNCTEAELDAASLEITVCAPTVGEGSVNDAVKPPLGLVVIVLGFVVTVVLSYDIVTCEAEPKLVPVTVIELAGGPVVGFSDITGAA